jgi:hypothetical protein
MVNNDYAYLHYFPKDGHSGFQSIGMDPDLILDEMSIFYTGTIYQEIEVTNEAVVPFPIALTDN